MSSSEAQSARPAESGEVVHVSAAEQQLKGLLPPGPAQTRRAVVAVLRGVAQAQGQR